MIKLGAPLAGDHLQSTVNRINAAGIAGKIEVYSGDVVPEVTDPIIDTLLCVLTLQYPCGILDGRRLLLALPVQGLVLVGGDARWCRVVDGADNVVLLSDVGLIGSSAWLRVPSLTLVAGQMLSIETTHEITA